MKKVTLTALFALITIYASAQFSQFQALYIYNFCKNTGWSTEDSDRDLVITVIGDADLYSDLSKLSKSKMVGSRRIVVMSAASAQEAVGSDVVYLSEAQSSQIGNVMNAVKGHKTLVISGKKGHCAAGAGIAFVVDGGKLGYEISGKNISNSGLGVSQRLISLGTSVE